MSTGPFALTVHSSVPANSVKELIAIAKQKPGELVFASTWTGASTMPLLGTGLIGLAGWGERKFRKR